VSSIIIRICIFTSKHATKSTKETADLETNNKLSLKELRKHQEIKFWRKSSREIDMEIEFSIKRN